MTSTLVLNAKYPHVPERVWQALTHPKMLAAWLMDNNFEPSVGHRFQFKETSLPGLERVIDCEVITVEPPRRLVYTWQVHGMPIPSTVTWMLTPIEGGTQLQLYHSGLTTAAAPLDPASLLQKQWYGPRAEQPWHESYAMLVTPDAQAPQKTARSLRTHALWAMTSENEWYYRLHETLPRTLTLLDDCIARSLI